MIFLHKIMDLYNRYVLNNDNIFFLFESCELKMNLLRARYTVDFNNKY